MFRSNTNEASCPGCSDYMVDGYNCNPFGDPVVVVSEESSKPLQGTEDLEAAAEEDSTLEYPLPDPKKSQIPLSTKTKPGKNKSLKDMFKKVFGSGGAK